MADVSRRSATHFGGQIRLLGHRMERAAGLIRLTLYWQANKRPTLDYQVFVHLLDGGGQQIAQADSPPLAGLYPTSAWLPGSIITDVHEIQVSADSTPAVLQIGLYDLGSLQRLPAIKEGGQRWTADSVVIPLE
jgi:hypothetical protein